MNFIIKFLIKLILLTKIKMKITIKEIVARMSDGL